MREGEGRVETGGGGGGGGWMREESANGNLQKSDRARKVARRDFRVRAPKKLVCMCIFTLFYKGGGQMTARIRIKWRRGSRGFQLIRLKTNLIKPKCVSVCFDYIHTFICIVEF